MVHLVLKAHLIVCTIIENYIKITNLQEFFLRQGNPNTNHHKKRQRKLTTIVPVDKSGFRKKPGSTETAGRAQHGPSPAPLPHYQVSSPDHNTGGGLQREGVLLPARRMGLPEGEPGQVSVSTRREVTISGGKSGDKNRSWRLKIIRITATLCL